MKQNILLRVLICVALAVIASPVQAEITGIASVIDGDTIEIHGQRVRFHGIDAPESSQQCQHEGKNYRCGQKAAFTLDNLITGKTVRCVEKDRDRYQRIVGDCYAGEVNLNAWMVEHGWALAYRQYSKVYVVLEEKAREKKAGIWAGSFENPWDYRHGKPPSPTGKHSMPSVYGNCLIKGNINEKGERIYHVQGTLWYSKTNIDTLKGERWFCSEDEAHAAGWRKAKHR